MPDAVLQAQFARQAQEQAHRDGAERERDARRIMGNPWDVVEIHTTSEIELACRVARPN